MRWKDEFTRLRQIYETRSQENDVKVRIMGKKVMILRWKHSTVKIFIKKVKIMEKQ